MPSRIAVVGPESTGKSSLCQQLAQHYATEWVPEYARTYIDQLDRDYTQPDLLAIAKGQLDWEDEKASLATHHLICDTTLLVIKIWSDHAYGNTHPWIEEQLEERAYDFYLLNDIDLPWTPDPQREHPQLRKHFFDLYQGYLDEHQLPYAIVSGSGNERAHQAVYSIDTFFAAK